MDRVKKMCLAIPMKVVELINPDKALVEAGTVSIEVSLRLVGDVTLGEYVLVHTGFAIEVMDIAAAEETLLLLEEMVRLDQTNPDSYKDNSHEKH